MSNEEILIEIDKKSGFCFGVINAIKQAEKELDRKDELFCLGDIVHNSEEVKRLESKGMQTINYDQLKGLQKKRVLFRAHGEPPSVYSWAKEREIELVDATCPVVVRLQKKIKKTYLELKERQGQIVIYGKKGHAEVNGLVGQTSGEAIVIQQLEDIEQIDFSRPIALFSQTTQPLVTYQQLARIIKERLGEHQDLYFQDTICRQVSNRMPHIQEFAQKFELVIFVAGKKSSNGKVLYAHCLEANPKSIFISSAEELEISMINPTPKSIGICGATSTPMWQMEEVEKRLRDLL